MLRYLEAGGSENWLEESKSEELEGFHWCGGSERDTTGILIWSKVFTMRTESGQDVAVVLMDTQVQILKTKSKMLQCFLGSI